MSSPSPSSVSFKSATHTLSDSSTSVAIPPYQTNLHTQQHRQDVPVLNHSSVSTHGPSPAIDFNNRSLPSSPHHGSITQSSARPRTYYTHNVLPTRLPPTPLTTFVKSNNFSSSVQSRTAPPPPTPSVPVSDDFEDPATLLPQLSGYLNMLSNKTDNTSVIKAPAPSNPPISHSPVMHQPVMTDDMEDLWEKLLTPAQDASEVAFGEYINESPLMGADSSPFEDTPYMDTPNLTLDGLFQMPSPDIFNGSPAIVDYGSFEGVSGFGVADFPALMGPPSVALQTKAAHNTGGLYRMPEEGVTAAFHPSVLHTPETPSDLSMTTTTTTTTSTTTTTNARPRKKMPTGTRPNITAASLIPLDAPIQNRNYLTPSSTSRKEFPAHFRKRSAAQAGLDNPTQEDDGSRLPGETPDQALARQIEAKRQSNTLAARRSRIRKQQYLQELEEEVEKMRREAEMWRERAVKAEAMLAGTLS